MTNLDVVHIFQPPAASCRLLQQYFFLQLIPQLTHAPFLRRSCTIFRAVLFRPSAHQPFTTNVLSHGAILSAWREFRTLRQSASPLRHSITPVIHQSTTPTYDHRNSNTSLALTPPQNS